MLKQEQVNQDTMVDFNKLIAAAMAEGASVEDIAKQMTEALNEASKPKVNPRQDYLDKLSDAVNIAIANNNFDFNSSIDVLTLCVVKNHPDWSLETIESFAKNINFNVKTAEKVTNCLEHKGDVFEVFSGALDELFGSKSEESEDCKCGCQSHRSDDEIVGGFLKSLGI